MIENLKRQGVNEKLLKKVEEYKLNMSPVNSKFKNRIPKSNYFYYGREILEISIAALLSGKNLLLVGEKSTGKNLLAENLSEIFSRPMWNISFHVNTDSESLIGTDTLLGGEIKFREGPITLSAKYGGFAILDEINMAKNESLSVLHSTLDRRRIIDIPGYELLKVDENARFIATMNYGYRGTRELNEALLSRFVVVNVDNISRENLEKLILEHDKTLNPKYVNIFSGLYEDIVKKARAKEISSRAVDLRGLLDALDLIKCGVDIKLALKSAITNKTFDSFEEELIEDIINLRVPKNLDLGKLHG